MIALDTNILVRYLTQDDPILSSRAVIFIEEELSAGRPGFISVPVLCELLWTLRSSYGQAVPELRAVVAGLLKAERFVVDAAAAVEEALRSAADPSDAIIHELGRLRGCTQTVTFDRKFARIDGVELLA